MFVPLLFYGTEKIVSDSIAKKRFANLVNYLFRAIPRISLAYTSLYWVTGIISVIHGNNIGNTRIVYDTFDPVNVWKWIADYKVTSIYLANFNDRP